MLVIKLHLFDETVHCNNIIKMVYLEILTPTYLIVAQTNCARFDVHNVFIFAWFKNAWWYSNFCVVYLLAQGRCCLRWLVIFWRSWTLAQSESFLSPGCLYYCGISDDGCSSRPVTCLLNWTLLFKCCDRALIVLTGEDYRIHLYCIIRPISLTN